MPIAERLARHLQRLATQRLRLESFALDLQLHSEPVQGHACVLTIRALGLEPCPQQLEAQRVAVLVLALAAAVQAASSYGPVRRQCSRQALWMNLAVPRQAHGCTSGPSSPSKHNRHLFSSSSLRAFDISASSRSDHPHRNAKQSAATITYLSPHALFRIVLQLILVAAR